MSHLKTYCLVISEILYKNFHMLWTKGKSVLMTLNFKCFYKYIFLKKIIIVATTTPKQILVQIHRYMIHTFSSLIKNSIKLNYALLSPHQSLL